MKFLSLFIVFSLLFPVSVSSREHVNVPKMSIHRVAKVLAIGNEGGIMASAWAYDKSTLITAGHFCSALIDFVKQGKIDANIYLTYLNNNDELITIDGVVMENFMFNEKIDICVLHKNKHGLVPMNFVKHYENIKIGDKAYVVGYPQGFEPALVTEGYVSSIRTENMPIDPLDNKIMVSAPCTNGNSGGVILNGHGEIIGMATMTHPLYHHLCLGIPSDYIEDYMTMESILKVN